MRYFLAFLAILIFAPCPSSNAETTFTGAGAFTCGQFAEKYRQAPKVVEGIYFGWAQGFMSGLNASTFADHSPSRDLTSMSNESQQSFLRSYCNDHPLTSFYEAALQLYFKLTPVAPLPKR